MQGRLLHENISCPLLTSGVTYLRGDQKETSDVDILVEFERPIGLIEFVRLKNYLSDLLGVNVDLVMEKALKPGIGQRILGEVLYV
jgi:predicted nucleotidyltransferase